MYELIEFQCAYVNGQWIYYTDNPVYKSFSHMEGCSTTADFPYTAAVVIVYEDGNYWFRSASFIDYSTNPSTTYALPQNDIDIMQTDYNGNTIVDRYVKCLVPVVIQSQGGHFGYEGDVTVTNTYYNWLNFEPQSTTSTKSVNSKGE